MSALFAYKDARSAQISEFVVSRLPYHSLTIRYIYGPLTVRVDLKTGVLLVGSYKINEMVSTDKSIAETVPFWINGKA